MNAMVLPGNPEIVYFPKVTLEIQGERLAVDALLQVRANGRIHQIFCEIDEQDRPHGKGGHHASSRLEQKVGQAFLRMTKADIMRPDMVDVLRARVVAKIAEMGPGEPEPEENRVQKNRAQRRALRRMRAPWN